MKHFTYLLVDLFALLVPFAFSFHPKIKFYEKWKAAIPAILISAFIFIAWDIYFTDLKVWFFNEQYVIGIYIFNLPLEEILFFICIPYSCLFTYHCFKLWSMTKNPSRAALITNGLVLFLIATGFFNIDKLYTSVTFISLSIMLIFHLYILKSNWMKTFYLSYFVLLVPFFICNGILTGTGIDQAVVNYNENENLGIRMLTIPFEDIFYGMLLILLNVTFYEFLISKFSHFPNETKVVKSYQ